MSLQQAKKMTPMSKAKVEEKNKREAKDENKLSTLASEDDNHEA